MTYEYGGDEVKHAAKPHGQTTARRRDCERNYPVSRPVKRGFLRPRCICIYTVRTCPDGVNDQNIDRRVGTAREAIGQRDLCVGMDQIPRTS